MRIGFVCDGFSKESGKDVTVFEKATRLAKKHDVFIFAPIDKIASDFRKMAEEKTCNVIPVPHSSLRIYRRYKLILDGIKVLKKYDLDYADSSALSLGNASILVGIPLVKTFYAHVTLRSEFLSSPFLWLSWVIEEAPQLWLSRKNIAISEYAKMQIRKIYNVDSEVIYLGADLNRFKPEGRKKELKKSVVYVGRIVEYKGLHLLIEAFKKANVKNSNLYIIGKAGSQDYYQKLLKMKTDNIHFLGTVPIEVLPAYYRGADVFASGTQWEGFGLPFVEAQACGTPVIGFNKASIPEVIENGKSGYTVKDIADFANKIRLLLTYSGLREEMSKNAVKFARKFTWEEHMKKYLKIVGLVFK